MKENLNSEQGIYHRKKRPCDVEPVFGNLKNNHHFKRFMLRGKLKVEVEAGLLALATTSGKRSPEKANLPCYFIEISLRCLPTNYKWLKS